MTEGLTDLLVVAAPTIDLIGSRISPRPGGPTLYAGHAGRVYGCRATALGPVGSESPRIIFEAHRALGVRLEPITYPGPPYTFKLIYGADGRRAILEAAPSTRSIHPGDLARLLKAGFDVVVFSPVSVEVPPQAIPLAAGSEARVVAVDPQGYARVFKGLWPALVPRGSYTFIHYSTDDYEPYNTPAGLVYVTRGAREGSIVLNGVRVGVVPRPPRVLDDPTGAGDAFTALLACCLAVEGDPIACARTAVDLVPEVIDEAHRVLEGLRAPLDYSPHLR